MPPSFTLVFFVCLATPTSIISQSVPVNPVDYQPPSSCTSSQFYQPGNLSCTQCGPDQVSTVDGLSCVCREGFIREILSSQCLACGSSEVVSPSGLFCLACDSTLQFSDGICTTCDSTSIYEDSLPSDQSSVGNRSCTPCQYGTWADSSKTSCVPCGVEDCSTCTGPLVSGGVCFSSAPPTTTSSFMYYNQYFSSAQHLCQNGNGTACQLLLNLCVLLQYSRSDPACEEARNKASSLPHLVPPLYYPDYGADEYLANTDVTVHYSTDGSSSLLLVASVFALNGTFLGLVNITDELLLCQDRPSRLDSAWHVGVQYQIQCDLASGTLADRGSDPTFLDLFLFDSSSEGSSLIPVPILFDNYRDESGNEVNRGSDSQWQFVRRLYLYQSVTDSPSYAEDIHIRVVLKSQGSIQIPYIRVRYSSLPEDSTTNVQASFSVLYRRSENVFNTAIGAIGSILVVMATVYSGIKVNGFLRRHGSTLCEVQSLLFMVYQFCSISSTLLFILLTISSGFVLILFKAQTVIFIALPEGDQEIAFITFLVLAFVFQLLAILYLIWKQVTIQIFFIDWEKPRDQQNTGGRDHQDVPVSIWRSYFVANEWNEIQSFRKLSPVHVLIAVLLFLEVVGLKHLSERDPSSNVTITNDRYSAPHSLVLRFSIAVTFYLTFALCFRLYTVLIHERFIEHKIRQFVDLCSISNVSLLLETSEVSVFILSHNLFGHYIHGRSVHGQADTNMKQMNENLIKERENRCSQRGLIPDTDDQTFEVAITPRFRTQYHQILAPILAERAEGQANVAGVNVTQGSGVTENSLRAYENMTIFLSSFIDHSIPDCDYVIKRKLLFEKFLRMEFYNATDRSILYTNQDNSFAQVLFYGNEWTLLLFDILLFCVVDLVAQDFILSAIVTYIVIKFISFARDALGRRNLGRKTLVDERFLI